jgi:hypothetical protein
VEVRVEEDRLISLVKQVSGSAAVFPSEVEFDIAIPQSDITPDNFQSLRAIQSLVQRILSLRRQ